VDGPHPPVLEATFDLQIEIRRIDPDEKIDILIAEATNQIAPNPDQFGEAPQSVPKTIDRETLAGVPGLEAFPLHQGAANADKAGAGKMGLERGNQARTQLIARSLSRNKGYRH